jgi:hypothetical protein
LNQRDNATAGTTVTARFCPFLAFDPTLAAAYIPLGNSVILPDIYRRFSPPWVVRTNHSEPKSLAVELRLRRQIELTHGRRLITFECF